MTQLFLALLKFLGLFLSVQMSVGEYVELWKLDGKYLSDGDTVLVAYSCRSSRQKLIGFDLVLDDSDLIQDNLLVFRDTWPCEHHVLSRVETYRHVLIKLPNLLRFRPDLINSRYYPHNHAKIRMWILDQAALIKFSYLGSNLFRLAAVKKEVPVKLRPPFSRPSILSTVCLAFDSELVYKRELGSVYKCPVESEIVKLLDFPMALSESNEGKISQLSSYSNGMLESMRLNEHNNFKFSMVFWMYLEKKCSFHYCAVFQRFDHNSKRFSPNIFITDEGSILVEVYDYQGSPETAITFFKLPLREWCRLLFYFWSHKWELIANCRPNFDKLTKADYFFRKPVFYDDVQPLSVIGGSNMFASFRGYLSKFTMFRRSHVAVEDLEKISDGELMFQVDDKKSTQICEEQLRPVQLLVEKIQFFRMHRLQKYKCKSIEWVFRRNQQKQCSIAERKLQVDPSQVKLYEKLRRNEAWNTNTAIGKLFYLMALEEITLNGFTNLIRVVEYLNKSSCLEYHMASFLLSGFYLHGLGVSVNKPMIFTSIKSIVYLLKSALNLDRLSLLALGFKHFHGVDEILKDRDLSYFYYAQIARRAKAEFYNPVPDENFPFFARLNDKTDMEAITNEDGGDLFEWLKDQAKKGVVSAQNNLANLMFWGTQGVKRNIEAVFKLYKMGAENNDPTATFNYGLSLLKGLGTEKNIDLALKNFENSAKMGHSTAFAALGYHAYEIEKNYTKAAIYWLEGWETKRNIDCAFNLGILWSEGQFLNESKDLRKAWEFWSFAAVRGQIDAQLKVAEFNSKGLGVITRNSELAAIWAKHVGEKSSIVGKCLHEGVRAFQNRNWALSIIYYLMVASTGVEVGSFNLAYLCELDFERVVSANFQTDCVWKYYNQSIFADINAANGYALNKMADFYFYQAHGVKSKLDLDKSIEFYAMAYRRGEAQGLFNLAQLIEAGYTIPRVEWSRIGLAHLEREPVHDQITGIYEMCLNDEFHPDSFIPCSMALYRHKLINYWLKYSLLIESVFIGVTTVSILIVALLRRRARLVSNDDNESDRHHHHRHN